MYMPDIHSTDRVRERRQADIAQRMAVREVISRTWTVISVLGVVISTSGTVISTPENAISDLSTVISRADGVISSMRHSIETSGQPRTRPAREKTGTKCRKQQETEEKNDNQEH